MRVPPAPYDDGYDVHAPQSTRIGKDTRAVVPVFRRPAESTRLCRSHIYLIDARSLRSTAADDRSNLPIPQWDESLCAE